MKKNKLKNEEISYKRIWTIAYPIIIGSIAQNIINVTDTAFLGRVGEIALGAGAIAGIFYLTLITIGWGFGIGLQIIVARRYGENNMKAIGRVIDHGLYFLLFIALLLFTAYKLWGEQLFYQILDSKEIVAESLRYINIRIFGLIIAFTNIAFRAFYVGITKTKVITYTTILMALVNVTLDYVLIFGKLGFKEYGIEGAAIASLCAEISSLLFFIVYTRVKFPANRYGLLAFSKPDFSLFRRILKLASPVMVQTFVSFFGYFIFFLFVERLGERPLAVSNIIRSLYVLLMIPIMGFASAANTLVSYVIGAGQPNDVMKVIKKVALMSTAGVLFLVAIGLFFPGQLIAIYTDNPELILASIPSYYVISGAVIFISIGFILFNGVSGTGKTTVSLAIELFIIAVYLILTYFIATYPNAQVHHVWLVEYFYAVSLSLCSFIYLKSRRWMSAKV